MKNAGFSLIEVLVATTIVAVGVASVAHLFAVSARANRIAGAATTALLLAQQKMEVLRADGAGLGPSPAAALLSNTAGYFEYVDRIGLTLDGDASAPPTGAVFVRRWAIEPLEGPGAPVVPGGAIVLDVLKVLVLELPNGGHGDQAGGLTRSPGEARLVSVKTRKAG